MEIFLAEERAYRLFDTTSFDKALATVEERKVNLAAGVLGSLFSRPNPGDIQVTYAENRLEPFWFVQAHMRTVYDRQRTFTLTPGGPEVKRITLFGQNAPVEPQPKGGPVVTVSGTEHCEEDSRTTQTFTGDGAVRPELARLVTGPKEQITDLASFQPEGVLVVPPEMRAAAVTRQVITDLVRPIKAQVIHEERLTLEAVDLCFRPVYAFEITWAAKAKKVIVECDGLTGEVKQGGRTLKDQFKSFLKPELLFDISAEAVGMVIPGGSIAMKLAKAAVEMKK